MNERTSAHHNQNHHDEMTEFEARLSDRIHDSVIDLPPAKGPDAAVDRAHNRTRHRRGVLAGAAALALVAGVVGQTMADDDPDAGLDTAGTMNVDNNGVHLDWQVTDDGLAGVSSYSGTDAGLYALSTAPGTHWKDYQDGNVPRAMYRLADDGTWTTIELGDEDPAASRISERGGSLYALSTAADTGQPLGSVSTDGGENWSSVPLKAIAPPSNEVSWGMSYNLDLASTQDVTFGLVTANFYFPAEELFPELNQQPTPEEGVIEELLWEYTDEGVSLIRQTGEEGELTEEEAEAIESGAGAPVPVDGSMSREVVRTVPWSDLGLTSEADLAPRTTAYLVDGKTWTETEAPVEPSQDGWTTLTSHGAQLLISQNVFDESGSGGTSTVRTSSDGLTWTPADAPGPGTTVASPAGLLHQSDVDPGGDQQVLVSTDLGATWRGLDLTQIDPRIKELGRTYNQVYAGPLGAAIVITEEAEDGPGQSLLAYSNDLTSWTVTDLHELSPESNWFGQVLVGTDRLVVQGVGDANGENKPEDTQTLIAVPTR